MALHYQPTAEDIRAGELGIELSKLPVKDRISALFCCCDVHELDEIAKIPRRLCRWGTLQSVHGALANLRSQFANRGRIAIYSIILSARVSTDSGILISNCLAVFRLITSKSLSAPSTGNSAGFAP
jgi:hypothetical protein